MTNKSLLLACCAALGVVGAAVILTGSVLVRSFDQIESAQMAAKAKQITRALEADLNQLALSNRDYAEWDAAADFAATHAHDFIDSNFTFETLDGMHVDYEWIVARDGTHLESAALDKAQLTLSRPAPGRVFAALAPYLKDIDALRERPASERIVALVENNRTTLLAFSAVEISRTNRTQRTGTVLVYVRVLSDAVLDRVRTTSLLPVTLLIPAPGMSIETLLPQAERRADAEPDVRVAMRDDNHVEGLALLRDINGAPIAAFSTTAERTIGTLGRRTTWSLMGVLIALLAAAAVGVVALVVRLQRSALAHEAAVRRHHNVIGQLGEGIVLAEPSSGRIVEANAAIGKLLNSTPEQLKNSTLRYVFLDLPETDALFATESAMYECRLRAADGHIVDAEVTLSAVVDGGIQLLCIVTRDLKLRQRLEAQEKENQRKLVHLAQTDALTGLPNRSYLHARLPKLLQGMSGRAGLLTVMFVDLDRFKHINESRGHGRGDELIAVIAKRLRTAIAAEDILVRMGGDEFVVVASMMPDQSSIASLAKRLMDAVSAPITLQEHVTTVTASVGIGVYPADGVDMESLLKHADIALYQAKEKGRNCYCFFQSDMNVQLSEQVALEQSLRRAIGTEEIFIEMQPVIDVFTGTLVSFEALVRWQHPEQGLIPPLRFIPVAEKSGLIDKLGADVLRKVVMQQCQWQAEKVPLAPVAINVSPMQFERTDFSILVHELCLDNELDPSWIHFEVTESSWLQESNKHIVALDTLRSQGSKVSIDDFGTGFSNLSYLKQLPVDTLKIDRTFVRNIASDASDAAIVKSIIGMARNLNLDVVAEGVETAEQLEKLREFGCQKAQGYYFSKPIAVNLCRALLMQMGEARRLTETVKARAFKIG